MNTEAANSPTPILDRIAPLPPPGKPGRLQAVFGFLLGLTAFLILFLLLAPDEEPLTRWIRSEFPHTSFLPSTGGQRILLVFDLIVGFTLTVPIHEAAHVLVGWCVGFNFNSLRVGPLQIDRPFRISRSRGQNMGEPGWTMMLPVKTDGLIWRMVVSTAAGSAANLFSGFAVFFLPHSMGLFSFSFVVASLFQGFSNLLPLHHGPIFTDGMQILTLSRSRERRKRFVAMMKLRLEYEKGVSLGDLSADHLAEAIAVKDNSPDTVCAYAMAFDAADFKNDNAKAAEYLETCLQYLPYARPNLQHALMSVAGVFQAKTRKRVDLAEQWLAALPGKTEIPWLRAKVEVAIRETNGDIEGALAQLAAIEKLVFVFPAGPRRHRFHQSLLRWKSELFARLAATPPPEEQGA